MVTTSAFYPGVSWLHQTAEAVCNWGTGFLWVCLEQNVWLRSAASKCYHDVSFVNVIVSLRVNIYILAYASCARASAT